MTNKKNTTFTQDKTQVGALFSSKSKSGNVYFTGTMGDKRVVAFVSDAKNKDGDSMTVINIYEHVDLEEKKEKPMAKKKSTAHKADLPF